MRGPRTWKRGKSLAVFFRSSVLKEFAFTEVWHSKRRNKTNTSDIQKWQDSWLWCKETMTNNFIRVPSNPQVTPAWISSFILFPGHADWFWQELIIYLKGRELLFYPRYIQIFKCLYASHLEGISGGSWHHYWILPVKQCANRNYCLLHFLIRVIPFAVLIMIDFLQISWLLEGYI